MGGRGLQQGQEKSAVGGGGGSGLVGCGSLQSLELALLKPADVARLVELPAEVNTVLTDQSASAVRQ